MKSLDEMMRAPIDEAFKNHVKDIFERMAAKMHVSDWMLVEITDQQIEKYPNAASAAKIKNSPLYKALL